MATNTNTSTAQNPFMEADLSKIFSQMKLPNVDMEKMISSNRKKAEALTAASQTAMESTQKFMQEQAEKARKTMEANAAAARDLMSADMAPEDRLLKTADFYKNCFDESVNNAKSAAKAWEKIQNDAASAINKLANDSYNEMKSTIKEAASSAK